MKIEKIILLSALLISIACHTEHDEGVLPIIYAERTIIVYMSADNDLSADALNDIEEMKKGYIDNGIHLIVFVDLSRESPYLLEISLNSAKTVKTYPEINSANASQMQEVLNDVIDLYPAHSYGLILWSHGTSWLPSDMPLRSFGRDHGSEMNIPDLSMSLPIHFDFILFDACLMGAVEVAYELKDKTDVIIASSTEIIYTGFPYDKIIPELVKPKVDFKRVGESYFNYYNNLKGAYRSATISVIETQYLEQLGARLKTLFEENAPDLSSFDRLTIQRLDVYGEQYCFDLFDFVHAYLPDSEKAAFDKNLQQVVVYKAHTQWFLSEYEIKTYCGLSCYIPHPRRDDLNTYYKSLRWYEVAGIYHIF